MAGSPETGGEAARPRFITLGITDRCNSRCMKCAVWRMGSATPELPIPEWLRIVSALRRWLGPFEMVLSGGEPTLVEGYTDIIRHAASLGVRSVLATNGLTLTAGRVQALADAGLDVAVFSIDGPPERNDRIKGVPGATARAWEAIEALRAARPSTKIVVLTVLMRENLRDLPAFVDTLLADPRISRVRFQALVQPLGEPFDPTWYERGDLWPDDPAATDAALDYLIVRKRAGNKIDNVAAQFEVMRRYFHDPRALSGVACGVGRDAFFVAANGGVVLCGPMGVVGDLTRKDPEAIWTGARAREARAEIRACRRVCHQLVNCCYVEDAPA
jgi:MoaA/NifB/PqqE/SkfB family radical SAM enzyme